MKLKELILREIKGIWGGELVDGEIGTPVIKTNNMTYGGYLDISDLTYRKIPLAKLNACLLSNGDMLVEKSGGTKTHSVGYVNLFNLESDKYVANNFILVLRPSKAMVEPRYLFYQLRYKYESGQIEHLHNQTTGIQNLKVQMYLDQEINYCSLADQEKISHTLENIEKIIEKESQELSLLDALIKSRFIELFDGKFPAESLYSVCEELFAGGDVKKDDLSEEKDDEHPYPIFTNGEANDGLYGYTSKARVFKEAVTVSGRGTIGYTSLRSEPFYPAVRLIVAVPNQKLIDACYLKYFIQSKNYGGSGSSIPQLTVPMIKNELIPVPPMEKQLEFKTFIHEIDKLKFNVQKRIEKYKELLNKKMDEYFN